MSTDGPAQRSPRLAPGRHRGGRRRRRPRGRARRRPRRGADRAPTGDGRDLHLGSRPAGPPARRRRTGMDERPTARLAGRGRRSGPSVHDVAADDPCRDLRSRGDDGRRLRVRRRLPAARRRRAAASTSPLGSIGFGWPAPRVLDDAERETLTALAGLAALAVDRARLASTAAERSEWFERMAHTDPLTGLANERTVGRILELELARAGRQGSEVSFAMFDVDDFQATNREGGHEAGDDVLRRVAAVLAESVRLVDTVGRIGGDEFVLVAPGLGRARWSRGGSSTGSRRCRRSAAARSRSRRAWPASRSTAPTPTALIAAAKDGLARAREPRAAARSRRGSRPPARAAGARPRRAAATLRSAGAGRHALRDDRQGRRRGTRAGLARERQDEPARRRQAGRLERRPSRRCRR